MSKPFFYYYEDREPGGFCAQLVNYIVTDICNDLDCDHVGQACDAPACTNHVCKVHRQHCTGCGQSYCADCYRAHLQECN